MRDAQRFGGAVVYRANDTTLKTLCMAHTLIFFDTFAAAAPTGLSSPDFPRQMSSHSDRCPLLTARALAGIREATCPPASPAERPLREGTLLTARVLYERQLVPQRLRQCELCFSRTAGGIVSSDSARYESSSLPGECPSDSRDLIPGQGGNVK